MTTIIKEEVFEMISRVEGDNTVPKNIKIKIQNILIDLREEEKEIDFRIHRALQELDEISEDNKIPDYIRTQIWSIASLLESAE